MSCFCCQKEETANEDYTYEYDETALTFCSEECRHETIKYLHHSEKLNYIRVASVWVLLQVGYVVLVEFKILEDMAWVNKALLFLAGLTIFLNPYGTWKLIVRNGIKKTRKILRYCGLFMMVASAIYLVAGFI